MRPTLLAAALVLALAGCSSAATDTGADAYCATVERTATAVDIGTRPTNMTAAEERAWVAKAEGMRAAMFERRDVAPAEIRPYWDTVARDLGGEQVAVEERELADRRIGEFEASNCGG
jgi:hypothetical protein